MVNTEFSLLKEIIWTFGSIIASLMGLAHIREYLSKPKIIIETNAEELTTNMKSGRHRFDYNYHVLNQGKNTALKLIAELHDTQDDRNSVVIKLSEIFEAKKNKPVNISGELNLEPPFSPNPPFDILVRVVTLDYTTLAYIRYEVYKEGPDLALRRLSKRTHAPVKKWFIGEQKRKKQQKHRYP